MVRYRDVGKYCWILVLAVLLSGCIANGPQLDPGEIDESAHERLRLWFHEFQGGSCNLVDSNPLHSFPYPACIHGQGAVGLEGCDPAQKELFMIDENNVVEHVIFDSVEEAEAAQEGVEGPGGHYVHCEGRFDWFVEGRGLLEGSRMEFVLEKENESRTYECVFSANSDCRVSDTHDLSFTFYEEGERFEEPIMGEAYIEWPVPELHAYHQSRMVFEWKIEAIAK